jgi:dTDP-4-dehydrorhamnose reductase
MRILITGASGLLGLNLALEARDLHDVTGVDRSLLEAAPFEQVYADLQEPGAAEKLLDTQKTGWLIHCAALADLEACETDPALARRLNAELPGRLAKACKGCGVKMIHISTDAVFDGMKPGAYDESDAPNPLGVYAETKLLGEQNVLSVNPEAIVARVNFYGFSRSGKRGLADFFVNNLSAGKPVKGFTDVIFNPTFVGDLSVLLLAMLAKDLKGLYHTVGSEAMSKYDFGLAIARRFGWEAALISPGTVDSSGLTARRAHNLCLSTHKLSTDLDIPIPAFSTGLDRFYNQFWAGYPHKIRSYPQEAPR